MADRLTLVLFPLALLLPYFLSGFLLTGDLRDTYLPLEDFYRRELSAGRLPTWDPLSALGYPVLASAQIGFWYPPLRVLSFLPPEPAMAVAYVAHVFLLALGVFWYGALLGLSRPASLLAALAFTGSGFVVGHLTHANILFGITWLPWALLCTDRLAATLRWRWYGLLSIAIALSLLGHLQIAFLTLVLCSARLLVQVRGKQKTAPWHHTLWTLAILLAPVLLLVATLTAVQLFPTFELLHESTRGAGGGFDLERANQHSFPLWQAITFLLPAFYGFPDLSEYWGKRPQIEMTAWIGVIPLLLAAVGALGKRKSTHVSFLISHFWTITAVIGFLLALGRWSPVRLLGLEPTLGIFSAPARYLVWTEFALAILAGVGLDRLRTHADRRTRTVGIAGLIAAGVILAGFVLLHVRPESVQRLGERAVDMFVVGQPEHVLSRAAYSDKVTYLIGRVSTWGVNVRNPALAISFVLLVAGSTWLVWIARPQTDTVPNTRRAWWLSGTALCTAVELVSVAWLVHSRVPWRETFRPSPVAQAVQQYRRQTAESLSDDRLYVVHPQGDTGLLFASPTTQNRDEHERLLRDLAVANIPTRADVPGIEWPAALDLSTASAVLDRLRDAQGRPANENLLDRLGVRYVAGSSSTPGLSLPFPARERAVFPSGDGHTITLWERPSARPRVELLAEIPQDIDAPLPATLGTARIVREHPQRLAIAVENKGDYSAALVLRDTFYPGWQATLDGVPTRIERADTLFRGVVVPPGNHTVRFSYQPRAARAGMAVSAIAWVLLTAGLLRRSRHTERP